MTHTQRNYSPFRNTRVNTSVRAAQSLAFSVVFCSSFFVLLPFFCRLLFCLSLFDLRIRITPLLSTHFSSLKIGIRISNKFACQVSLRNTLFNTFVAGRCTCCYVHPSPLLISVNKCLTM